MLSGPRVLAPCYGFPQGAAGGWQTLPEEQMRLEAQKKAEKAGSLGPASPELVGGPY